MSQLRIIFSALALLLWSSVGFTQTLAYQGQLSNPDGEAITASYPVTFSIYSAATDGERVLWTESHDSVDVVDGLFTVQLGAVSMDVTALGGGDLYLGVSIDGGDELQPRMMCRAQPFARSGQVVPTTRRTC